ncbi:anion exchange family protein [Tothia fuscella]|uniref:Anion exchange family protein n=1 Tax=Tothia fuscella TaxID=1048955 RepID=A0A9P4NIR0_9PEZI|nr:anion exchange family protein [Tothia fuscella]
MIYSRDYSWETDGRGWRRHRELQPFRGMVHDIRRRLPYYWSDIQDGFNYKTFSATIRMYFVNILPALAFQLDMNHNTGGFYGINEALFSSALAALVFSLLSAQPLTIVGITGLISLFNYTIYNIIKLHDVSLYPAFMVWVGIWSAITHWMTAIFNWCDYMRYVTDYSSNTFALYVGTIYIIKGVQELAIGFYDEKHTNGFLGVVVAILYSLTVYYLEKMRTTILFRAAARDFLSDYAYPIATVFWVGFSHFPGIIGRTHIECIPITKSWYPTVPRPYVWLVEFWHLPVKWIFVALPIGMLVTLLFYYDHNLSSLTAQEKKYPLKKPAGFHWDFFLLGWTTMIAAFIGLPYPNGLVPQAPVHTDALTTYEDQVEEIRTNDGEIIVQKKIVAKHVTEQRVSHLLMGLLVIGTMSRPLLVMLGTIPRALLSGVFFVVGWGSIEGNGIINNLIYLITEERFIQPSNPLLTIQKRRILLFVSFQLFTWAASVAISQTIAAIGFPVIVTALIPFRLHSIPKIFSRRELEILDDLTATNEVVLASLGGKPVMKEAREDLREASSETSESEPRKRESGHESESGTPRDEAGLRNRGIGGHDGEKSTVDV